MLFGICYKRVPELLLAVTALLCGSATLFAQEQNNMSLQQLKGSIDSIINSNHTPGLMLGIIKNDTVLFSGGFGYADLKAKRPVDGKTLFRLGSITKMFVSLSILKLVQEGKLHLNDELKKIAPEIPFINQWEASHPVRIINLLEHTAGFDDMKLNRMCSQDERTYTGREMVLFQQHSLVCRWKPGERYAYSNPGYVILGYIIEKLSGKSYDGYIAENLLQPLAMNRSNFNLRNKLPLEETNQYVVHGSHVIQVPVVNVLMPPAGSLWSCADDMLRFLQLFLANGKPLFADSTIHEMETPHSALAARAGLSSGYALANTGLFLYNNKGWRGHGGLMGTCFSTFAYNRQIEAGFIMSSNGNQQNPAIETLVTDYLEQSQPAASLDTIRTDTKAIAAFLGQYQFASPRNEIAELKDKLLNTPQVYLENNHVVIKNWLDETEALSQTAPFVFALQGAKTATVIFTENEAGKNVMVMNGAFFEQVPELPLLIKRWLAVAAILFMVSAALAGLISLPVAISGRLKKDKIITRLVPMPALLLLVWAVINLLQVQTESYLLSELTKIDTRSVIVFSGTLLFGVFAAVHFITVLITFKRYTSRLYAFYWITTAISFCYLAFVLWQNGWIGLRTWAM